MSFASVSCRRKIFPGCLCWNAILWNSVWLSSPQFFGSLGLCFSDYSLGGVVPGSTSCCGGSRLTRGSELPGASAFSGPHASSASVRPYSNWLKPLYLQLCSCISSGGFLIKKAFTPEKWRPFFSLWRYQKIDCERLVLLWLQLQVLAVAWYPFSATGHGLLSEDCYHMRFWVGTCLVFL